MDSHKYWSLILDIFVSVDYDLKYFKTTVLENVFSVLYNGVEWNIAKLYIYQTVQLQCF